MVKYTFPSEQEDVCCNKEEPSSGTVLLRESLSSKCIEIVFCQHVNTFGHYRADEVNRHHSSITGSLKRVCVCVCWVKWFCCSLSSCYFSSRRKPLIHLFSINAHLSRAVEGQEDVITVFCTRCRLPLPLLPHILPLSVSTSLQYSVSPCGCLLVCLLTQSLVQWEVNQEVVKTFQTLNQQVCMRTVQTGTSREATSFPSVN